MNPGRFSIRRAQELVQRGEKVEAVMLMVGYRNKTHFVEAFRRYAGCTPGELSNRVRVLSGEGRNLSS